MTRALSLRLAEAETPVAGKGETKRLLQFTSRSMRLTDRVRHFAGLRALVIGDAILDTYIEGTATRLCAEGPVPVVRRSRELHTPGGAANTACNLRTMGADVTLVGTVGRDDAGTLLIEKLAEHGVDDDSLLREADGETIHKTRVLADGQYVVRFDNEAGNRSGPHLEHRLADLAEAHIAHADLIVISDYGYGVASAELIERIRQLRTSWRLPLVIDAKQLGRFRTLPATAITPNITEACHFLQSDVPPEMTDTRLRSMAAALLGRLPTDHVAITLGDRGAYLASRDGDQQRLPARAVKGQAVGAGDSFTAAFALGLATRATAVEATTLAIQAAQIAVTKPGTAVVHASELIHSIEADSSAEPLQAAATQRPSTLDGVADCLDRERGDRTIVFTNGVFDLLHAGHVELLRRARELGDLLVVGVNSDRSVRRLKGRSRPINQQRDRLAVIAALGCVDYAFLFDEDTASPAIRRLRPDIYVKGGDYDVESLPEAPAMREVGGRIVILPHLGGLSTSLVIDRILSLSA